MLTPHQEQKLIDALILLQDNDRLVIKGSAGVGKTFMVNQLIKELRRQISGTFYASAPTNKAVAVLKEKITGDRNTALITIQKALKIQRVINPENGKVEFKPKVDKKYPPLKGVKYLIVDESSMLSLQNLMDIEEHSKIQGCKVIFIGDEKQLNPVGESNSPVFLGKPVIVPNEKFNLKEYPYVHEVYDEENTVVFIPYPEVELSEIVRQRDGNPIINLSRNLNLINSKESSKTESGGYIFTDDYNKIIKTLAYVNGSDELKYLAYTNTEVNKVNKDVRKEIYGLNPAKIEIEETIVFDAPYKDFYTNEEIKVERLLVREKVFTFKTGIDVKNKSIKTETATLKYYSINYKEATKEVFDSEDVWDSKNSLKQIEDNVIVIHEDSEKKLNDISIYLKNKAKNRQIEWIDYYSFVEQFASMKYNHAITIHKSQGSTYKQAILNVRDANLNQDILERTRLFYTAVTRASDLLILYNV